MNDMRSLVQLNKIKELGFADKVKNVKLIEVYTVEKTLNQHELTQIAEMLANPISQSYKIGEPETEEKFDWAVEIGFLPGVTDNVAHTAKESIEDLFKKKLDENHEGVYTSTLLLIEGDLTEEEVKEIAKSKHNKLIERASIKTHAKYSEEHGMDVIVPRVHLQKEPEIDQIDMNIDEDKLAELGKKGIKNADGTYRGPLALEMDYLNTIRDYYNSENRRPNDIELESIAQTWSEHCKHTIFAAEIDDDLPEGLYKGYIKKATYEIRAKKGANDFCVSVFKDNAGGIIFDENWVVCDKAETHNTPSALEPFGGAITGIVGVNRDIAGFGKGAKPIMNKYGYCFAYPEDKDPIYRDKELTNEALKPRTISDGVIAGVNAGGNCSGIPTPQGWQYFDDRYKGKPLVFVGTVGMIPKEINGEPSWEKEAKPGDKIIMVGGRVGQDGIHGATFSSEALDEGSPATAVQIGDPITQKKFIDAIVKEIRDMDLYTSITDNGAGGLSCSVSEMARECGGCTVELDQVPLKYPNLDPWKIWISESQERMTLAVPPENVDKLISLLEKRGAETTVIGTFNNSGRCIVNHKGKEIMNVNLDFLHDGLPKKHLETVYEKPQNEEPEFSMPTDLNETMLGMLKRHNICGYSYISNQYDHTVQGHTIIYPLQGPGKANNYASAIKPLFDSKKGVIMSQGLNPRYSDLDTYHMSACAIDTAIRNAVSLGADIDYMALMDNFCWCSSTEQQRLGELKDSAKACYDYAVEYETPYISGKDSMFNDFQGYDKDGNQIKISIPPTLLISSLSVVDDISKVVTMDAKTPGDLIYILGTTKDELGGSEYFDYTQKGWLGNAIPQVNAVKSKAMYKAFKKAVDQDLLASSISVTLGGLGIALAKKAISGQLGINVNLAKIPTNKELRPDHLLFSETQSRILVTIKPENKTQFEEHFQDHTFAEIGSIVREPDLIIKNNEETILNTPLQALTESYHSTFKNY
ncbi:phosphoribosylformylglycinamidine synthase [Candidatus Peregrinibacteria bacterium]|nr:phosphoribosylformylglycinamidine synthase [Candidatus Peregrinibacteria bacterium]MBT4056138.1 phosphoribosylformylglycinamidine synthase [Candidatus Peregrinibacteria bacterium]